MIKKNSKIYLTGISGMVGSACYNALKASGYNNIVTSNSKQIDLRDFNKLKKFLISEKPELIINAAAKVGGIIANNEYPYEFLMDNMLIQNNLIKLSHELDVNKFIFLGSSCIYPKLCSQPIKEDYLLTGSLEPTNQWYAIAKISGVKLIESLRKQYGREYFSVMPTNLYGPNDNFNLETSHVIPALLRKFYEAKSNNYPNVTLFGSGTPKREFLHVNDLANAIIFLLEKNGPHGIYNVGSGKEFKIIELANIIKDITGYSGSIIWDKNKPDGTPRKIIDSTRINSLGWKPSYDLISGLNATYKWFLKNKKTLRT